MKISQSNFWSSVPPANRSTDAEAEALQADQDPISDTVRTAEEDVYTTEPVYF